MLHEYIWLVPGLPLFSFLVLFFAGNRMSRKTGMLLGTCAVGASAVVSVATLASFASSVPEGGYASVVLWQWMSVDGFEPSIAFHIDALSLLMTMVITGVGFLIHVYSTEYMADDERGHRFFSYLNLFVTAMLILVLADSLLFMYVGWEGVGLCSYLLIGFWFHEEKNSQAARKAFIVTRIGDAAMALGLFLLATRFNSLTITDILQRAPDVFAAGSLSVTVVTLCLLGGAVGKSAQLPLQTWLPDAMAGPTPASALIHAATMVTAGVYLIARMHPLFELAPLSMMVVACVGAATLLVAGVSALFQTDIKRILAYSTVSQIGYMFLALGVGAWSAAMFHFMTHAFFKALLFLGAGTIIVALHHEQDIYKMGGLRESLPGVFWTFLAGALALTGFPILTSGFWSKDAILYAAWSSHHGHPLLWAAGLLGALLTVIYTLRLVFIVFLGESKTHVGHAPSARMMVPLAILAVLSVVAGFIDMPLLHVDLFSHFMATAGLAGEIHGSASEEMLFAGIAIAVWLVGAFTARQLFAPGARFHLATPAGQESALHRFGKSGCGFDALYDVIAVRPFVWICRMLQADPVDRWSAGVAGGAGVAHEIVRATQTGRIRWYAAGIALGAVATVTLVVWQ